MLAKMPASGNWSTREKGYLDAVHKLVSEGDQAARWRRYAAEMRALHARFPDDDEAATLYAVALLGCAIYERDHDHKDSGFRSFAEAAAIGLAVLARNPDHPGAAHYVIHAFDDPEHAVLALPAARRYALIAPEAYHALHMPSHIFVQLGMWREAAASNESAWAASEAAVRKKKLSPSYHDFHSLSWLQEIDLELGQRHRAEEVLGRARADLQAVRDERAWMRVIYAQMVAGQLIATDGWTRMADWLAPLSAPEPTDAQAASANATGATCHPAAERAERAARVEEATLTWLHGEAALAQKDATAAERAATGLAATAAKMKPEARDNWRVRELELRGRATVLRGDAARGLTLLQQAAQLDEREPPSGPVDSGVTPRERIGDLQLAAGRASDALQTYRHVLDLHPRRARALYGAARAAAAANDPAASSYWAELDLVWAQADADQPGLDEVHRARAQRK